MAQSNIPTAIYMVEPVQNESIKLTHYPPLLSAARAND
jgi:hypothetical protein